MESISRRCPPSVVVVVVVVVVGPRGTADGRLPQYVVASATVRDDGTFRQRRSDDDDDDDDDDGDGDGDDHDRNDEDVDKDDNEDDDDTPVRLTLRSRLVPRSVAHPLPGPVTALSPLVRETDYIRLRRR
ncbi:uncharacterized protein LOC113562334 [Ooceraea biroi]|uniref:uncharacterized protein LOC113562334 n=1 Tax=Ooceraea biroi TaxID=2015173 RepID=UPI000F074B03|nr:uncharacterized protein LOC113562334 [Ooceraea biroi]